jgi:hypothetical protein
MNQDPIDGNSIRPGKLEPTQEPECQRAVGGSLLTRASGTAGVEGGTHGQAQVGHEMVLLSPRFSVR